MCRLWERSSKKSLGDLEAGLGGNYSSTAHDVAVEPEHGLGSSENAPHGHRWSSSVLSYLRMINLFLQCTLMSRRSASELDQTSTTVHDDHSEAEPAKPEEVADTSNSGGEFAIGSEELVQLVRVRSLEVLNQFHGVRGLATRLKTDLKNGVDGLDDEILRRRQIFGANTYPCKKRKSFWSFIWKATQFLPCLVMLLAAVINLLLRIKVKAIHDGWYVEACTMLATFLYIIVRAITEYKQSRQFEKLCEQKRNVQLEVIRGGRRVSVSTFDIVVGDIVPLKNGGQVPANGVLVSANSLKIDDHDITGSYKIVQKDLQNDPFLLSGSKVIEGIGTMLVTSVGMNTEWWLKLENRHETDEEKPFQVYLKWLAVSNSLLAVLFTSVVFIVQLCRYYNGRTKKSDGTPMFILGITTFGEATEFMITSLSFGIMTIIVAVPVGLPTAFQLNLANTMRKMMKDKALVQKLSACERMGSVTTILCHKTGVLTLNQMSVVDIWAGGIRMKDMDNVSQLPAFLKELIIEGIAQNTNGSVVLETGATEPKIYGSPTEHAILSLGNKLGMRFDDARSASPVLHTIPFNQNKKYGGVALQLGTRAHVHWKGSAKIILSLCVSYMDGAHNIRAIDELQRKLFEGTIENMCMGRMRCAALAYRPYEPESLPTIEELSRLPEGLVLLAIIGIKLSDIHFSESVIFGYGMRRILAGQAQGMQSKCAILEVRMVTDDDVLTAQSIAMECGILGDASGFNVRTGTQFRDLSDEEREHIAGEILVFAQASPSDNLLLVKALKKRGHVVAATGMGIHDTMTLHAADVSLAMGIGGTAAAKENSDIIILDDKFATILKVIQWCRYLYTNIQRYILFRLTVIVSAMFICAIEVALYDSFPLNAAQLLLFNFVVDIFGALALTYRPTAHHLMGHPPVGIRDPLITKTMWSKLVIQVIYLVLSLAVIKSDSILKLKHGQIGDAEKVMNTFIFISLVYSLVFGEFEIGNVDQTFKEIIGDNMFLLTITSTILFQIIMIKLSGIYISSIGLDLKKWVMSILAGFISQLATRFPFEAYQYRRY